MLLDAQLSSASSPPTSLRFHLGTVIQNYVSMVVGKGISDNLFYITSLQRRVSFGFVYLFSESVIVSPKVICLLL